MNLKHVQKKMKNCNVKQYGDFKFCFKPQTGMKISETTAKERFKVYCRLIDLGYPIYNPRKPMKDFESEALVFHYEGFTETKTSTYQWMGAYDDSHIQYSVGFLEIMMVLDMVHGSHRNKYQNNKDIVINAIKILDSIQNKN